MMLVAGAAMACGLAACSDDDTTPSGNITPADQLYLPRNNATIMLETGNTTHFEWAVSKASKNGYITYELLFDKVDGDFSQPLYVLTSDNNGYEPSAEVASTTLNTVAKLAGADLGETATVKWTVRAWCGLNSEIYGSEAGVRTISISRVDSVDPLPSEVRLTGDITENQSDIVLFSACPVASTKSGANQDREEGAYECFTKLTAGKLTVVDDLDRYFKLGSRNKMEVIADDAADKTGYENATEGIYWIYLNFNTMTYKIKEIQKVEVWTHPWFGSEALEPMTYDGNGAWSVVDYAWKVWNDSGQFDSRYHFICTYADGSQERWSHIEDDCRSCDNPESKKYFWNVYRFTSTISDVDDWGHSWKTRENIKEGMNKKVTFHVYMNNTQDTKENYFIHERSFSDGGAEEESIPTAVNISGAATENQATLALCNASVIHAEKGNFVDSREEGAFEIYTKLTAGTLSISDNNGKYYSLADNGNIQKASGASGASATTIKAEGIYRLYMNFNAMRYSMQKIDKVEYWRINGGDKAELTYDGNGVWSLTDYAWTVREGNEDSRYKFICSFADGSAEYWGHCEDDCRQSEFAEHGQGSPEKGPYFYNIFRFTNAVGEWDHTWKVNQGAKEGFGQKVTFHVYMNNTKDKLFLHERSFK